MRHTPVDEFDRFNFARYDLLFSSTATAAAPLALVSTLQATFEVTTLADVVDATDGVLSLREANDVSTPRYALGYVPGPGEPEMQEREQIAKARIGSTESEFTARFLDPLPGRVDWREVGGDNWVTPIKDQGPCGSCVAFGTLAVLESQLAITLERSDFVFDLSESHLFFCVGGRSCESGWNEFGALQDLNRFGVTTEGCMPYLPEDTGCYGLCPDAAGGLYKISKLPLRNAQAA